MSEGPMPRKRSEGQRSSWMTETLQALHSPTSGSWQPKLKGCCLPSAVVRPFLPGGLQPPPATFGKLWSLLECLQDYRCGYLVDKMWACDAAATLQQHKCLAQLLHKHAHAAPGLP
eukprot:1161727-Pelagomonas_calceolata.AAC.9